MIALQEKEYHQKPLIHVIHEDDTVLLDAPDAEWFRILYHFPWEQYRGYGAMYYDALYEFNQRQAKEREEREKKREEEAKEGREGKKEARQRLLFERATMQTRQGVECPLLYDVVRADREVPGVSATSISPGVVPFRIGGKKPKCFFGLLKSFLGTTLMGFPPEPEHVHRLLVSNLSFARVCGFAPRQVNGGYDTEDTPSLRKLEQFDQIMTENGLWDKIKASEVKQNLERGVIEKETELVGDTTHYDAYSSFETVKYVDEKGKEQKKSQSPLTKRCRCEDMENCEHEWELSDDGAGTIVKSGGKKYWGHKAGVIGYPRQGIPLDARAISDAATFDGETLYPHVEKLFDLYPEIRSTVKRVLYDSACDSRELKEKFRNNYDIELKTSFNPRRKKAITEKEELPRGIEKITPYGIPVCMAGYDMEYKGMRHEHEKFIYQAPTDAQNVPVCQTCEYRKECCPNTSGGRIINISFDLLPQIDPKDPPMAKRYKAIMSRRTSVERMIKTLKRDLGDDRLSKRGNGSFQAYLDKTMIAFHVLLRN